MKLAIFTHNSKTEAAAADLFQQSHHQVAPVFLRPLDDGASDSISKELSCGAALKQVDLHNMHAEANGKEHFAACY